MTGEDHRPRYFLSGADSGDQVDVPAEVHQVLHQVVEAMQQGLAVTVVPQTMVLTTQQAADLLGASRPTLIKLLGENRYPTSASAPTAGSNCGTCSPTGNSAGQPNTPPSRRPPPRSTTRTTSRPCSPVCEKPGRSSRNAGGSRPADKMR